MLFYFDSFLYKYSTVDSERCKDTEVKYGCVATYGTNKYPIVKSEIWEIFYANNGEKFDYYRVDYSTTKPNSYMELYEEYIIYSNDKVSMKMTAKYKYDKKNSLESITAYYYDSKNRKTDKLFMKFNKNEYVTFIEDRSYYKNGKTNEKLLFYYNGKSSGLVKSAKYYKYRSTGEKKTYKKQIHNKKGKITKMYTYTYNSKGIKKSNKYGNSYKYVTYFKTSPTKVKKVTKAKYNSKGKLGSAKKIKATKLTKKYYTDYYYN